MLVLNSFGLQNALERSPVDIGHFFSRCHYCATTVATLVRDELGPSGFMRYSPDSHFVQTSYAVLSLLKVRLVYQKKTDLMSFCFPLKLVRPEFQAFLDDEQKTVNLVKEVADVLESIAANHLHTPALYSGFLRALISARVDHPSSSQNGDASPPPQNEPDDNCHHVAPTSPTDHTLQNTFSGYMSGQGGDTILNEFHFDGEMGPVADMSTFPPTMASGQPDDNTGMLSMDSILSNGFWDSVLMPGEPRQPTTAFYTMVCSRDDTSVLCRVF